jgi:hypothetical protein
MTETMGGEVWYRWTDGGEIAAGCLTEVQRDVLAQTERRGRACVVWRHAPDVSTAFEAFQRIVNVFTP